MSILYSLAIDIITGFEKIFGIYYSILTSASRQTPPPLTLAPALLPSTQTPPWLVSTAAAHHRWSRSASLGFAPWSVAIGLPYRVDRGAQHALRHINAGHSLEDVAVQVGTAARDLFVFRSRGNVPQAFDFCQLGAVELE